MSFVQGKILCTGCLSRLEKRVTSIRSDNSLLRCRKLHYDKYEELF